MLKKLLLAGAALAFGANVAAAKELKSIGISLGSMGNPFFVALAKGAEFEASKVNPNVKITTVGYDYDLGKQNTQIDNFIAAGVDLILLNPGDPNAIEPAIKRAQAAGIIVVAVDTHAEGANATVETNNIQAGTIACEYLIKKMGGKGDMIIVNGPQVSSVIERVQGLQGGDRQAPRRQAAVVGPGRQGLARRRAGGDAVAADALHDGRRRVRDQRPDRDRRGSGGQAAQAHQLPDHRGRRRAGRRGGAEGSGLTRSSSPRRARTRS